MSVSFGRHVHSVIIQSPVEVKDAYGEADITSWVDVATVFASVEPIGGREFFAAGQVQATTTHRVRCRYVAGVVPKYRVLFGSRAFDIDRPINVEERNKELEILATERT